MTIQFKFTSFASIVVPAVLLAASQASAETVQSRGNASALCTDSRTLTHHDPNGQEVLSHYSGQELITQSGNDVTVEFFPDQMSAMPGTTIHYERITREDAQGLGFETEDRMAVYMLHGDEGMPSEYFILPERFSETPSGQFQGAYGTSNEDGEYDATSAVDIRCQLSP